MSKPQTEKMTRQQKRRKKKQRAFLRLSVLVFLSSVFIFSLVKLISICVSYLKNRNAYSDIRESAISIEAPVSAPHPEEMPETEPEATSAPAPTATPEPLPFYPDWEQLKTVCPDIVGWLYLEGTNIHYPVVQTWNNNFYLDHNARREENTGGALFLDAACYEDSMNLLVYGHRMKDDSMFGQLPNYSQKSYLQEHPLMYYLTPEQNYRVEIFACRTVKAEPKYFAHYFADENAYREYLEKAVLQSYWAAPVSPDTQYKTLTLVTCSVYQGIKDPRLLVHGRLIPMH